MNRMRYALSLVTVLLITSVNAASSTNPIVVDSTYDGYDFTLDQANDLGRLDLTSAWVEFVSTDEIAFGLSVRDLVAASDSGAFRNDAGGQSWHIEFEHQDRAFEAAIVEDADGDQIGALYAKNDEGVTINGVGTPYTVPPSACAPAASASLEFDYAADTIVLTTPRQYTIEVNALCDGTPGTEQIQVDFDDNATFDYFRATSVECPTGDVDNNEAAASLDCTGSQIDVTVPRDHLFVFDELGNDHLVIRPLNDVVTAQANGSGELTVLVHNPTDIDLATDLVLDMPDGWTAAPATRTVLVPAGGDEAVTFTVTPGPDASNGLATLRGAGVPIELLMVIGDRAFGALDVTLPILGTSVTQETTLYLHGAPAVFDDQNGVRPGALTAHEPVPESAFTVSKELSGVTPLGIWVSDDSHTSHMQMGDNALIEVPVTWSGADDLEVVALLGTDLPLDWDGEEPLSGVAILETPGDSDPDGDAVLVFSGSSAGVVLSPGEDLEVALYALGSAGSVTATIYDEDDPASVRFGYSVPIVTSFLQPTGDGDFMAVLATLTGIADDYVDTTVAITLDGADVSDTSSSRVDLQYTSFSGITETSTTPGVFDDDPTATQILRLPVLGTGMELDLVFEEDADGGTVWMQVLGVRPDGTMDILHIDRSLGLDKHVTLAPVGHSLSDYSDLEVHVIPRNSTPGASYEVIATAADDLRVPGGLTVHRAMLTPGSASSGTGTFAVNDGTADLAALTAHFTEDGPTLAPRAEFVPSAPAIHAGNSVTFIDHSFDPEGDVASWSWDFGDGTSSTESSPTHTFATEGTYPVTLTVTDGFGVASERAVSTLTVVPPGAELPLFNPPPVGNAVPLMGTVGYYANAYALGTPHLEDYTPSWMQGELEGTIGVPYLETANGDAAYVFGTVADHRLASEWTDGLTHTNHVGATVTTVGNAVTHSIGDLSVTAEAVDGASAFEQDDGKDGRIHAIADGSQARSLSILTGTIHSDVRTLDTTTTTTMTAPVGSWLAYGTLYGVQTMPVADANGRTVSAMDDTQWFAVYDPAAGDVVGAVLSGGLQSAQLAWDDDELTVVGQHDVAIGDLDPAAQYLVAYHVGADEATRYAGVMEVARESVEELGIVYLSEQVAASVSWAAGAALVDAGDPPRVTPKGFFTGQVAEWDVRVSSAEGGIVRVILPARYQEETTYSAGEEEAQTESEFVEDPTAVIELYAPGGDQTMNVQSGSVLVALLIMWGAVGVLLVVINILPFVVRRLRKRE